MISPWILLGVGIVFMVLVFLLAWAWAVKINNYSLVDAVWAFGIGATGVLWLALSGAVASKILVAASLVLLWSVRLGWHLQKRIRRSHPEEDARYGKLRESWEGKVAVSFLGFFQMQALSVVILALPFLFIATDLDHSWSVWETAGLLVVLAGISGEGLADAQMAAFKEKNRDAKVVCRDGLWRYSRHPNYFFESVIWMGFYVYACGSEWGWATIHAPALITFLLLKVTGIPPTEAASLERKGDAYRDYQATTSAFIPLPPKSQTS